MIPPYKYTMDDAVLAVFSEVTKRQREKLLRIFAELIVKGMDVSVLFQFDDRSCFG